MKTTIIIMKARLDIMLLQWCVGWGRIADGVLGVISLGILAPQLTTMILNHFARRYNRIYNG